MAKPRTPKPLFEKIKIPLILAAYIAVSEWADPFPFNVSLPARIAVALLILFVLRELHHARLEVDEDWAGRTARAEEKLRGWTARVNERTWLRIQRLATWALAFWLFGVVVNTLTDRCDTAIQCGVLAPRMAIENLPTFIQFSVFVALSLFQIVLMMWMLIKIGSYKVIYPGTVSIRWADVYGQDLAKAKIMEQVRLLEDSEAVEKAGGHIPKGALLYGPPGTGKTYLAKAAAGESSKPLILIPPGAFVSTFWGVNLLKIRMLFRHILKLARRYGGVIVFMDEIDSLGSRGGQVEGAARLPSLPPPPTLAAGCVRWLSASPVPAKAERTITVGSAQEGTLEAFLAALDGMDEPRGLVNRLLVFAGFRPLRPPRYKSIFLGATNMPGRLDPALLRAGRLERLIHVDYPKIEGRRHTYEGYLAKTTHTLTADEIDWAARNHAKGTGAEVARIVNEAILLSFRDGRKDPGTIWFPDMMGAMLWVRFGESEGSFERDEARWNVAVHEAGHAVAFHLLRREREQIWFASIEQRGTTGGMVAPTSLHEDWIETREELLAGIQVTLASRVAEELVLGTTTNGHGGDAEQATTMAQQMVAYGHSEQIGVYDAAEDEVREHTEKILQEALGGVRVLLAFHKGAIVEVARLLMEKRTVPGGEIHRMLEAP